MFHGKSDNIFVPGILAILLATAVACSGSDFAGGGGTKNGKPSGKDGGDADGGTAEAGTAEAGEAEGSDNNDGPGTDGTEAGDADGIDGSEAGDSDDGLSDGDEELKKTRSDMKIVQTLADTKLRVKIELLSNAKVIQTEEFESDKGDGKINKETILKNMCRRGLDTCVKVTFIGEITQVAGGAACVFVAPQSATMIKVDVDGNGAGLLGNCGPGEDETFEISCDESKSLKVQNCTG